MKSKLLICLLSFNLFCASITAQTDTLTSIGEEIVVTATKTERKLSNVAVPVTIISQKNIQQAGSLRIRDILQEQTGIFLTSGFGTGVQMQGLGADYTLILIDGEPLVGRTAGVLDLNRITVGNIKKIEIVKGPSSSLYGSEALAGVINIITEKPKENKFTAGVRYGTYNTLDANVNTTFHVGKLAVNAFINNYNTDGYSIRPFSVERAANPIWKFTNNINLSYPFSEKTKLAIAIRNTYEDIRNEIAVTNNGAVVYSKGKEVNKDININPVLTHQFNAKLKNTLRLYATEYQSTQNLLSTGAGSYSDFLNHRFLRIENQTDINLNANTATTIGAGFTEEGVRSNRYDNTGNRKTNTIAYAFGQLEYNALKNISIITGLRYDYNQLFASAFSPKLAVAYTVKPTLKFTASYGRGFKAPDFRQLYLNFTNIAAGGYSVYGTIEAQKIINQLNSLGQIGSLESDFYRISTLEPEVSNGLNIGMQWQPGSKWQVKINAFRNDVKNLIDSRLVAYKTNGSQIFSYLNVRNAYTQGFDADVNYKLGNNLLLSTGYQFLLTADKEQLREIKEGKIFTKDANGFSRKMDRSEYIGLPNRSKHMANFKLSYEHPAKKVFANIRCIYRSKWAVSDKDGNGLYNTNDEFATGFTQVNISAGKSFSNGIRLQLGIDNIGNYIDVNSLPNLPGRQYYLSFNYSISKNKTVKK